MIIKNHIYLLCSILLNHSLLPKKQTNQYYMSQEIVTSVKYLLVGISLAYKKNENPIILKNMQLIKLKHSLTLEYSASNEKTLDKVNEIYELLEMEIIADEAQDDLNGTKIYVFLKSADLEKVKKNNLVSLKELLFDLSQNIEAYLNCANGIQTVKQDHACFKLYKQLSCSFLVQNEVVKSKSKNNSRYNASFLNENMTKTVEDLKKAPRINNLYSFFEILLFPLQFNRKTSRNSCYLKISSSKFRIIESFATYVSPNLSCSHIENEWIECLKKYICNHNQKDDSFSAKNLKLYLARWNKKNQSPLENLSKLFLKIKTICKNKSFYADLVSIIVWKSSGKGKKTKLGHSPRLSCLFLHINLLVFGFFICRFW